MARLGVHLLKFTLFYCSVGVCLLCVDFWAFDRISNPYLMHAINARHTEKNIIIGSSKTKWSVIDSLMDETTILAEGGQFTYASLAVLLKLSQNDLLKEKYIFIELQESDEIKSGFGQWWYFSEAFVEYRYASLVDYPVTSWLPIMARIIKDIAHFSPNSESLFTWAALEKAEGYRIVSADADTVFSYLNDFRNCTHHFSRPYNSALIRANTMFKKIEKDENCKIFVILVPYPSSGCIGDYVKIFGKSRLIDLTAGQYTLDDFQDNKHLNSRGAAKFTQLFNNKIRKLEMNGIDQ